MSVARVTVIVPHWNDLDRLDLCLSALERQTLPREAFRIVVGDNLSPQGEAAVRAAIQGRADLVLISERGAGPSRNAAAAFADTPYLAFTDADCVPDPAWLEEGLRALERGSPPPDFVGGGMAVTVRDPRRMSGPEAFESIFAFDNRDYVLRKGFTVTANLFCPRSVFEQVGPFRNGVSEDLDWCYRARNLGFRIGYAPAAIVSHPARADWDELRRKWLRIQAETAALMLARPGGRWRWIARSLALPVSIVPHLPRIVLSDQVRGWGNKRRALATLVHSRLWRFADSLRYWSGPAGPDQ